jgi:tetratricopeptide (TPR) repeat protein
LKLEAAEHTVPAATGARPIASAAGRAGATALLGSWLGYMLVTGMPQVRLYVYEPTVILHILAAALAALYVFHVGYWRRLPGGSPLDWPLFGLLGAYVAATVTSVNWRVSLELTLQAGFIVLVFFALADVRFFERRDVARALLLAGAAASAYALWVVGNDYWDWVALTRSVEGLSLRGLVPPTVPRVHDVSDHPNMLAMTLVVLLPLYAAHAWRGTTLFDRALGIVGGLAALGAIFFTLSRGAWAASAVALAVSGAGFALEARLRRVNMRPAGRGIWLAAGAAGALIAGAAGAGAFVFSRWDARPGWLFRGSLSPREDALETGWNIVKDHVWTGAGPGGFGLLYPEYSGAFPVHALHAHNGFVQTAIDLGVLGLAVMVALAVGCVWIGVALWRRDGPVDRLAAVVFAAALAGFAVHNVADAANIWKAPLIALGGIAALAVRQLRDENAPPRRPRAMAATLGAPRVLLLLALPLLFVSWWRIDIAHRAYSRSIEALADGDYAAAVDFGQEAADQDPRYAIYHLQLGLTQVVAHQALSSQGRDPGDLLARAIAHLERGIELEPRTTIGRANLAWALALAGEKERALWVAVDARERAGSDTAVLMAVGEALEFAGYRNEAIETFARAVSTDAGIASSSFWTVTPERREMYPRVLLGSVLALNPCTLGTFLLSAPEGALLPAGIDRGGLADGCRALSQEHPDDLYVRVNLARMLMAEATAEAMAEARVHLDFAVRRQPDFAPARRELGRWYDLRGDREAARHEWLIGAQLDDPESILLLGRTYSPQFVPPGLVSRLERLLEREGSSVRFPLVDILYFRMKFFRGSPAVMFVPAGWQRAAPRLYLEERAALDEWKAAQGR